MKKFESIFYGFGIIPEAMVASVVSLYLLFFATDILGMKASTVGLVLLIANIFDIVSDIIIMNYVDARSTKFGTYRPWLFLAVPMSVCLFLIFLFPDFLNTDTEKLLWMGILYFLMVPVFQTGYLCPYLSLRLKISDDKNDQLKLTSSYSVFENAGQLLGIALVGLLVTSKSVSDLSNWKTCTLVIVAISVLSVAGCFFGTRERVESKEKKIDYFKAAGMLVKEPSFLKMVGVIVALYIPWTMFSSISVYFLTYNLGHGEWLNPISLMSLCFSILVGIAVPYVASRIGKKKTITICSVLLAVAAILFSFVTDLKSLIIYAIIKDIGQIGIYVCIFAYSSEINEKIQKKNHIMVTGLLIGLASALAKIGYSLGNYLSSVVLTLGKYVPAQTVQSDSTLIWIRYSVVVLYFAAALVIYLLNRKSIAA